MTPRKPDRFSLGLTDLIAAAEALLAQAATVPPDVRAHARDRGMDLAVLEARVSAQLAATKEAAQALAAAKAALADANREAASLSAEVLAWSRELATQVRRSTADSPEADIARWTLADGFRAFRMPRLAGARRWLAELQGEERRAQLALVGVRAEGVEGLAGRVEGAWARMAAAKRARVVASGVQRRAWAGLRPLYHQFWPMVEAVTGARQGA